MLRAAADASDQRGILLGALVNQIDGLVHLLDIVACCCAAVLISLIRSLTRRTFVTISSMVRPALDLRGTGADIGHRRIDQVLDLLAALAERCDSSRISVATTAKPRPCSPARAASTAAFSARMLV